MMGKPVIRGTRVTVELILRKLAEGSSEAELLQDYPHLTAPGHPRRRGLRRSQRRPRRSRAPPRPVFFL